MKVILYDKQKFTRVSVPNVGQLSKEHNGKYYEWLCEKDNGYTEKYKCSRFDIERIENEG